MRATYSKGEDPVHEIHVARVASTFKPRLDDYARDGVDGKDIALGVLTALRTFVLDCVGPSNLAAALAELDPVLNPMTPVEGETLAQFEPIDKFLYWIDPYGNAVGVRQSAIKVVRAGTVSLETTDHNWEDYPCYQFDLGEEHSVVLPLEVKTLEQAMKIALGRDATVTRKIS